MDHQSQVRLQEKIRQGTQHQGTQQHQQGVPPMPRLENEHNQNDDGANQVFEA